MKSELFKERRFTLFLLVAILCTVANVTSGLAQNQQEPQREHLLNNLSVVLRPNPAADNVLIKLRIHAGAAFDLAGKAGTMALLGDALFPDPETREFFAEQLGGQLEVRTDYDAIHVSMTGRATEFERMVDLLRTALVNTQLSVENISKLRIARLKLLKETSSTPGAIADRALASRVFGDFPYGRPMTGTGASLTRVERSDVMFARERFLNANNATILISGGVTEQRAMRALRQLLGGWGQSEQVVPSTFRQTVVTRLPTLIVDQPHAETAEVRVGVRGLARSDPDFAAVSLLTLLIRDRWQASLPALAHVALFVRHEAHILPGLFVMGASVPSNIAVDTLGAARNAIKSAITTPPSTSELDRIRSEAVAEFNKRMAQPASLADLFLDQDTFHLGTPEAQMHTLESVAAVEVQGSAARLLRDTPLTTVIVGNTSELRKGVEQFGPIDVVTEQQLDQTPPPALPAKPGLLIVKPKQP